MSTIKEYALRALLDEAIPLAEEHAGSKNPKLKQIKRMLKEFDKQRSDSIAIEWSVEDIDMVIEWRDLEVGKLSKNDKREILRNFMRNYDCEVGLTWDGLESEVIDFANSRKTSRELKAKATKANKGK
jgi:hypothetical protein